MYIVQPVYRFTNIKVTALEKAINQVINKFDILGASFHYEEDEAYIRFHQKTSITITIQDWTAIGSAFEREKLLRKFLAFDKEKDFDFEKPPLIRPSVIHLPDNISLLVLTHHHLLLDGISSPIVSREILKIYNNHKDIPSGRNLDKVKSFGFFLGWLNNRDKEVDEVFWSKYLEEHIPLNQIPCGYRKPDNNSNILKSSKWSILIKKELVDRITEYSREIGVMQSAVFLSALGFLCCKYTGSADTLVGLLLNGRPPEIPGSEAMVGMFMNTLPYRYINTTEITVKDIIVKAHEDQLHITHHQYISLKDVARICSTSNESQLIKVILDNKIGLTSEMAKMSKYEKTSPKDSIHKDDITSMAQQSVPFHCNLETVPDGVSFTVTFDRSLVDNNLVPGFCERYKSILNQFCSNPDIPVKKISIMLEGEEARNKEYQSGKRIILKPEETILRLVLEQCKIHENSIAIIHKKREVSYKELLGQTKRLASKLSKLGVTNGDVVALQINRSEKVAVLIHALFYLGATYVPIETTIPESRVNEILEESQAKILIKDIKYNFKSRAESIETNILFDETDENLDENILPYPLTGENIAYIIFTSGSTGKPKGIKIPHRVILSRILADEFPIHQNEIVVSKTSFAFVDFLWELFLPLVNGGTCHILPANACKDPVLLCSHLTSKKVKRIVLVPSLLSVILDLPKHTLDKVSHIALWFSTGEPLAPEIAKDFYKIFPKSQLFNLYGASEVWDISFSLVGSEQKKTTITAGKPIANTRIFILDDSDQPVPAGFEGNILVSGSHVASGYVVEEVSSNPSFCKLSISGTVESCWRTGDRGYWDTNGELVVLGRKDSQIKLRGFRIELNEIESVVKEHPLVKDCVVSMINAEQLGISILFNQSEGKPNDLREFIGSRLPQYMIPSAYYYSDNYPHLTSGKIDRTKIAEDMRKNIAKNEISVSKDALTRTEQIIIEIASKLFKRTDISIDTHFFEAGGHSLLAVRLLSKISRILVKQIPLEAIFSNPILRDLSKFVDSINESALAIKVKENYDELSPLSLAQRGLWIVDALSEKKDTYIISNTISLEFEIDEEILTQSVAFLIKRHLILRTTFVNVESEPYQKVHDNIPPPVIRITQRAEESKNDSGSFHLDLEGYPLEWSLQDGPLFYVLLQKNYNNKSLICLKMHHIISDGSSIRIFIDELLLIYENLVRKRQWDERLVNLKIQYKDYATWQYDWCRSDEFSRNLDFWSSRLSGRPTQIEFVRTFDQKGSLSRVDANSFSIRIGPTILKRIRSVAKRSKTTLFNVLLTIFGLYISRHCAEANINIGTPVTGRTSEELEPLIGFFVNLIIYPLTIDETLSFEELVSEVALLSQEVLSHQNVQFEQIVSKLAPERDEKGQPLFQVMLVHETVSSTITSITHPKRVHFSSDHANYDYLLLVREHEDFLELTHQVRASIFSRSALRSMAIRFNCLLSRCTKTPNNSVRSISMLSKSEYKKIAYIWNNTKSFNPFAEESIASLYFKLSERGPENTSVVDSDIKWSRRQIIALAIHYQKLIRLLNSKDSQYIGLMLEKGAHQVALLLAVNGLGHAFVPLDRSAPAERTKHIIDTCKPSVIFYDGVIDKCIFNHKTHFQRIDTDLSPSDLVLSTPHDFSCHAVSTDYAYACFTSGSTGIPKGVLVSNYNIISLFHAHSHFFSLSTNSRILSTLGFYFDAGIGEQVRALLSGATIFFTGLDLLRSPSDLLASIEKYAITHVGIPPSVLQALCTYPRNRFKSVEVLVTAGEALTTPTAKYWGANRTIITGHGATETTVGDTVSINWNLNNPPSLGRPLPNMRAYVVDKNMQLNPPFVIGQLVITGPQVSSGYLGDLEKTRSSFISDLPGVISSYKYYLTGDLVYFDSKGVLHFAGRADSQVKIRGHRIEPSDIEAAALSCPEVTQAVCTCIEKTSSKYLILYYVSLSVDEQNILKNLEKKLPNYMIPSKIIKVEKIPVTQNGKVNFKALPKPLDEKFLSAIIPASTATEKLLSKIWEEVLSSKNISTDSNFFSIGGDSIKAVQLLAKCSHSGIKITPLDLYKYQTISSLGTYIDSL